MRISDWSTDVCSSDLAASDRAAAAVRLYGGHRGGWRTVGGGVPAFPAGLCPDGGTAGARRARRMTAAIVVAHPTDAAVDYGGGVTDCASCVVRNREIGRASCRERVCQYG